MLTWLRHRRSAPGLDAHQQAVAWQAVSLLLEYPERTLVDRVPMLRDALADLPPTIGGLLAGFLDRLGADGALTELQTEYVDTFDVTRRCCLHLTYFTHGDTRKRGVALVQFKQAYRRAGVEQADEQAELPDHLCVLLEFGATCDPDTAWKLLNDHRVGIELLHRALARRDSTWLPVVQALRETLPALDGDDEQALRKLIAQGPPQEQVGLDSSPYGSHDPALDGHPRGTAPPVPPPAGTTFAPLTLIDVSRDQAAASPSHEGVPR